MLSFAAQVAWKLIGWVIPWASPKFGMALAVAATAAFIWGHGYMTGRDGKAEAVAARDLYWTQQIEKANADHERRLAEVLEAGESEPDTPADRSERLRLCQQSPTCREGR